MFRVKIALVVASLMVLATAGAVVYLKLTLNDTITAAAKNTVEHAERSLRYSSRLEALELTTTVARLAHEPEFADALGKTGENDRRRASFAAVQVRQEVLEKELGHRAAIVGVIDKDGKLLARDLNINALYGDDFKKRYPSVEIALAGTANRDIWNFEGQMYRVGAAPIRGANGQILGALIVGYVQKNADAVSDEERLGAKVAYFFADKIQASSFHDGMGTTVAGGATFTAEEKALAEKLFSGPKLAEAALVEGKFIEPFRVTLGNTDWIGAAGPLPGNATKSKSGFVVLVPLSPGNDMIGSVTTVIVLFGGFCLLAMLITAVLTSRRFLVALDKIEAGVTEVINGNRDYVFESPSPDFEGLANGVNVMLARLLGRPEPGEDEDDESGDVSSGMAAEGNWQGDNNLFMDETATAASELAAEPADAYYERTWLEYCASREKTGEGTEGLNRDKFLDKLRQNETAIAQQHGVRMVRFKVQLRGNQTTLKPYTIS